MSGFFHRRILENLSEPMTEKQGVGNVAKKGTELLHMVQEIHRKEHKFVDNMKCGHFDADVERCGPFSICYYRD